MKQKKYLHQLFALLMVLVLMSMYLFDNVNFSIQHTNQLTDFLFEGSTDQTQVTSYFAGDSDYVGGAKLTLSEEAIINKVEVGYDDGTTIEHNLISIDKNNYYLNVMKSNLEAKPKQMIVYSNDEQYDLIELNKKTDMLYYFADENQTYRHIYIHDQGVFLGEYLLKDLPEDAKQNVVFEFCHKDESTSTGYHIFAKKMVSLYDLTIGEDLGFTAFSNGERFDANKDVYVIVSFSDTNVIEMPLTKGAN